MISVDKYLNCLEYYKPFVENMFIYLNNEISPLNRCNLIIGSFSNKNYGDFRKPNNITIFLGSVIENFYDKTDRSGILHNVFKSVIALVLTHELFHAAQDIQMTRYGIDSEYMNYVEDGAQYSAMEFIRTHREDFIYRLECDPCFALAFLDDEKDKKEYNNFNENYFIDSLIDVIYRNMEAINVLRKLFEENNTVIIEFDDFGRVIIKMNGEYLFQSIDQFNHFLNLYRRGRAVMNFTINTNINHIDDGIVLMINTQNRTYNPINFETA